MKASYRVKLSAIAAVSASVILICPFLGIQLLTIKQISSVEELRYIFWLIRVPRTLAAFVAGGGLAVAGMVYQALFRNPLASPYTLGVSSGASLGAAICILTGASGSFLGISPDSVGALVGAVATVLLVYSFAWKHEGNSTTLLLAGVVVSTICLGLIMFLHYISPVRYSFQIMRWFMGGIDGVNYRLLMTMFFPVAGFLTVIGILLPQLDQFLTGEALAHSRGINITVSRNVFVIISALAVGAIVAVCGPIGFVGIMAPHVCRMLLPGARHRILGVCAFLLGGCLLTMSDTLARIIIPPAEIPVGIITALLGGPFFLLILFRRKSRLLL